MQIGGYFIPRLILAAALLLVALAGAGLVFMFSGGSGSNGSQSKTLVLPLAPGQTSSTIPRAMPTATTGAAKGQTQPGLASGLPAVMPGQAVQPLPRARVPRSTQKVTVTVSAPALVGGGRLIVDIQLISGHRQIGLYPLIKSAASFPAPISSYRMRGLVALCRGSCHGPRLQIGTALLNLAGAQSEQVLLQLTCRPFAGPAEIDCRGAFSFRRP